MDRLAVQDGEDDIGKIRLGCYPVVFGGNRGMFGMGMVDPQQGPLVVERMLFGRHIVDGGDFEAAGLISLFRIVDDQDVDHDAGPIAFLPAEQEPATLVGEGIECIVDQ